VEIILAIVALILGMAAFDALALRFGTDSRDVDIEDRTHPAVAGRL
jgi:hypothetical protein